MATKTQKRRKVKVHNPDSAEAAENVVQDQLEVLARQGARQMLMMALDEEVNYPRLKGLSI